MLKSFTRSHRKIDKFSFWMLSMTTLQKVNEFAFTSQSNQICLTGQGTAQK